MSREDLLTSNINIADGIIDNVLKYAPDCLLLFVTNPVDVVTYYAWKKTGWPRNRIFGQAGVLDSSRMASFIAMETGYSSLDINTMVLGGHGDTMIPMHRYTTIAGIPISNFLSREKFDEIAERTRHGGAEILALRQNSSAYDAPAASVAEMVDAIVHDRKRILPTVSVLEGEYGYEDIAIGVPAVLGKSGMEEIILLDMNDEETTMFHNSANIVQKHIDLMKQIKGL
jgi:malate dehydrogenase